MFLVMLARYQNEEMRELWSDQNKFSMMRNVLAEVAAAQERRGLIRLLSQGIGERIKLIKIDKEFVFRIRRLEKKIKHETVAFITEISKKLSEEDQKYIHFGLTSSDLLDSVFSLLLKEAGNFIDYKIYLLLRSLRKIACKHKETYCVARTHGMHAEKTTFGLKMLQFYAEFCRHRERLKNAIEDISVIKIAGPVGVYGFLSVEIERIVAEELEMKSESIATQVIPRDRYANYFLTLANIASSLSRLATELRNLQRTEIDEVRENFSKEQKGSSSMPHKRNPILSESICGLARIVQSFVIPALENVILWHERDMSHSSAERFIAPQSTSILDFMLSRTRNILDELSINIEKMLKNINLSRGNILSHLLLSLLVEKGLSRKEAHDIVQVTSAKSSFTEKSMIDVFLKHPKVKSFGKKNINKEFIIDYINARSIKKENIDKIFSRVLAEPL